MRPFTYTAVSTHTPEEFASRAIPRSELEDSSKFTCSDANDIANLERLLDLNPGTLSVEKLYLQRSVCQCGKVQTMYDFVFTALIDAEHDKSFVVHTLIGNKYIINRARRVRCSQCSRIGPESTYSMTKYTCTIQN